MDKKSPKRKVIRLKGYDYSQTGVYFVTICTEGRKNILSEIRSDKASGFVGEGLCALPKPTLTAIGQEIEKAILYINNYDGYVVDKYVIMPNHIHLLISVYDKEGGHRGPPLHNVIGQLKSYTTHKTGKPIFQRSFYDHIVRDQSDYQNIWQYIDTNPAKWQEDKYYNQ